MKKVLTILIIALVMVGGYFLLNKKQEPRNGEVVKIGALLPLTGKLANFGEDVKNAMEIAKNEALEKKGIEIEIVYEDSAADPKLALSAAKKLIETDQVSIVITGPGSTANMSVAPYMQEAKVPFLAISATPKLNQAGDYIFKVIPDINDEVIKTARYMRDQGFETVSLIYDSSADSNVVGKDIFIEEFKKLGGKEVYSEGYDLRNTNDFRPHLFKVKDKNPDAVYFLGTDSSSAIAVPQARGMGLTHPIFGWSATDSQIFLDGAKEVAEGFILTTYEFACDGTEEMMNYCIKYANLYGGKKPIYYGAHAYDVLTILGDIIKENVSRESLKDEFRNALTSKIYHGLTGVIDMDTNGNVQNKKFVFRVVRNGKFVKLEQ